jgi:very-short-patch-repair endonuclease
LRAHRLSDLKFRRQYPIGPYIADFACFGARLIIELDGGYHADGLQAVHDERRKIYVEQRGWRVLRLWNVDVLKNPRGVQETILAAISGGLPEDMYSSERRQ